MGCSNSKSSGQLPADVSKHMHTFEALGLDHRSVSKLYEVFSTIDGDGSGSLSLREMLVHLNLNRTPFSERVFSIFDEDNSGEIDFREFVLSLWNYCTLTKSSLILFAFDLYDTDGSGSIDCNEMISICMDVYGSEFKESKKAQLISSKITNMNALAASASANISVEKFARFSDNHPGLLYPAFAFQLSLQNEILGEKFWLKLSRNRVSLPSGEQISVQKLIHSHLDRGAQAQIAPEGMPANSDAANMKTVLDSTGTVYKRRQQTKMQAKTQGVASFKKKERNAHGKKSSAAASQFKPRKTKKTTKKK